MTTTEGPDQAEMDGFGDYVTEKWLIAHCTFRGEYQNGYSDWGYIPDTGVIPPPRVACPSTEWLRPAGFQDFQATPEQSTELERRYKETQKEADKIRHSALDS
ncbi:hypothetical protein Pmar_PMAR025996 [Perkinsus marinus ATCC 50983]|uniref:Uncharacterized protein n=1 Tax=Perkinsus marinus (strain ATCC 50983 / TXsc) TaxID=423536 RepID=C5LK51_PERM5|nr:hypothetical protein Pmar_PMAR025996 [Perkinsus marinus ATCC 50983]EER02838.1 hypothetical protein Pmar_PMAR025996 [Perkinsus marinus ATCC 50983]|eukprot:XP_002771022.1 hypothetical protein Pmar_PMAR025996 [Perkinsus marinus ATCC 50983]